MYVGKFEAWKYMAANLENLYSDMSSSSSIFGIGGASKSSAQFIGSLRLCSKSFMKNYNMKNIYSKQSIYVALKDIITMINGWLLVYGA
jgi:hypothetical protein